MEGAQTNRTEEVVGQQVQHGGVSASSGPFTCGSKYREKARRSRWIVTSTVEITSEENEGEFAWKRGDDSKSSKKAKTGNGARIVQALASSAV